ncbi:MAG: aminoacyl-tRNA hydrolase [Bacteriovoracaceae bacterium]|nr:aminoacyl-tRNA hydrolase [Bacteriovoracaceae bacterium]
MTKLIVGLGNPGIEYELTKHNIGWLALDQLSFCNRLAWKEKFKGEFATYSNDGEQIVFLRPQTFMNLSGESVASAAKFFKVELQDILVIHDELDLPYGTLSFKNGGGLAGHNGLKSIAKIMGGNGFLRLRMGIGRPVHGNVSSWVLSGFHGDEDIVLPSYLKGGADAIESFIAIGFGKAAGKFSKKSYVL